MKADEGSVTAGVLLVALGAFLAGIAFLEPPNLRAPPWVMYACGLAFVFAGGTLVARARRARRLAIWLPVPLLACMAAPPLWLAFGTGRRQCTITAMQGILRLLGTRTDLPCRVAFGFAAVVGLALVALALRHAIRASRDPTP